MQVKKEYLQKYLRHIAIDQLTDEYQQKGYVVLDERFDSYSPDIAFANKDETIVVEIIELNVGKLTAEKKERIHKLSDSVRSHPRHQFLVALVNPPKDKKVEINGLEPMLLMYLTQQTPVELTQLFADAHVKKILSTNIDTISVSSQGILVIGGGVISVDLDYWNRSDSEKNDYNKHLYEHLSFDFELLINYNNKHLLEIAEVHKMKVDTSVYD